MNPSSNDVNAVRQRYEDSTSYFAPKPAVPTIYPYQVGAELKKLDQLQKQPGVSAAKVEEQRQRVLAANRGDFSAGGYNSPKPVCIVS